MTYDRDRSGSVEGHEMQQALGSFGESILEHATFVVFYYFEIIK